MEGMRAEGGSFFCFAANDGPTERDATEQSDKKDDAAMENQLLHVITWLPDSDIAQAALKARTA